MLAKNWSYILFGGSSLSNVFHYCSSAVLYTAIQEGTQGDRPVDMKPGVKRN